MDLMSSTVALDVASAFAGCLVAVLGRVSALTLRLAWRHRSWVWIPWFGLMTLAAALVGVVYVVRLVMGILRSQVAPLGPGDVGFWLGCLWASSRGCWPPQPFGKVHATSGRSGGER
jgi:hypothetical protein